MKIDPKALLASLGSGIRQRRTQAGLTIAQLAELAGVDAGFLAYIETAKKSPSLITTAKLAAALRIPLAELFEDAPKEGTNVEHKLQHHLHSLLHGRSPSQKADLLDLFKKLKDPEKVQALRRILGK